MVTCKAALFAAALMADGEGVVIVMVGVDLSIRFGLGEEAGILAGGLDSWLFSATFFVNAYGKSSLFVSFTVRFLG